MARVENWESGYEWQIAGVTIAKFSITVRITQRHVVQAGKDAQIQTTMYNY